MFDKYYCNSNLIYDELTELFFDISVFTNYFYSSKFNLFKFLFYFNAYVFNHGFGEQF